MTLARADLALIVSGASPAISPQNRDYGPETRQVPAFEFTNAPIVGGDVGSFCSVDYRGSTRFINDISFGVRQSRSLLLPRKEDAEAWHECCKLVCNVLQHLRTLFERVQ